MASIYGKTVGDLLGEAGASVVDYMRSNPLESAALATSTTPILGDVLGLLSDAKMYATQPEERNLLNYGLTAAGLIPFVPAASVLRKVKSNKLPEPKNEAEEKAKEVLELLQQGRESEITEDIIEKADPKYLADNYDLPMDTESRMNRAREMGYDVDNVRYHGTDKSFDKFNPSEYQRGRRVGVFTTDNPYVAATYAPPQRGGQIYPVYTKDTYGDLGPIEIDAQNSNWNQLEGNLPAYASEVGDETIDFYYPEVGDFTSTGMPFTTNDIAQIAKESGRPSVTFNNLTDRGPQFVDSPLANWPSSVRSDFNSDSLRSIFARFDPRLSRLSNLSAGLAGGVVLTPAMLNGLLSTDEEM